MDWIITAIAAYLLGSLPFGLLIASAMGLGDIRQIGSGNIGATNVLRTGNKRAAALTLLFDAGKGVVAVLVARAIFGEGAAGFAGLFVVIGHMFPVFLKFKGGKGVATFLGTLLALNFPAGLAACAAWLIAAALFRFSSLAAIIAAILAPAFTFHFYHMHGAILVAIISLLVVARHHANIRRLVKNDEPKIGQK
ncbi:MAG: glycerol-3-phosphate 1-O-acyltransferase PlsY [Paracoccaceae bacterium]|jgi:acyl phosphate:glycerol-3-phosphate acyltransferase|nr:glycerol-3-phosphate 1-O-acyltransferase PlsY [Paracoccaceae bacterium]